MFSENHHRLQHSYHADMSFLYFKLFAQAVYGEDHSLLKQYHRRFRYHRRLRDLHDLQLSDNWEPLVTPISA